MEQAPEGGLKIQQRCGKTYYYHKYKSSETNTMKKQYIRKKEEELIKTLAQKGYYKKVKPVLEKNLQVLEEFVRAYQVEKLDGIYDSLTDARKKIVTPIQTSLGKKLQMWENEVYEPYKKYQENLKFETEKGEMVRSKSEVIIANILYQNRDCLLYKYERPLEIAMHQREMEFHPDFTIINLHTGKIMYWEHAGRMDDPKYANEFVQKMNTYIANGFLPGKDVIVTYETVNFPLNIHSVKMLVKDLTEDGG